MTGRTGQSLDEQQEIGAWLTCQCPQNAAGRQAEARAIIAYGGHSTADMIMRAAEPLVHLRGRPEA